MIKLITRLKWRWAGHFARTKDTGWTKGIMERRLRKDKRSKGTDLPKEQDVLIDIIELITRFKSIWT